MEPVYGYDKSSTESEYSDSDADYVTACNEDNAEIDRDVTRMTCSSHSGNLISSLRKLWCDDSFCDVTIKCGNFEMKAHKNILASATDYFKAMFLNDMKEASSEIVDLSEMPPEVVKQCITFIYSGELEISKEYVKDLLDASEMMQIPELSKLCVRFLANNLTMETCAQVLTLSNIYEKKSLDFPIANFLMRNFEGFLQTEDFKSLNLASLTYCLNLLQDGSSDHEILKWNGIIAWVESDIGDRSRKLVDLLSIVEWSYLPKKFIMDEVCRKPLVCESVESLQFLTKVAFGNEIVQEGNKQQTQLTDMFAFCKESRLLFRYNLKTKGWRKIVRYPARFPDRCDVIYYKGLLCVGNGVCFKILSDSKWRSFSDFKVAEMTDGFVNIPAKACFSQNCVGMFGSTHSSRNHNRPTAFGFGGSANDLVSDDSVYRYCKCFGLGDYIYMMTTNSLKSCHASSLKLSEMFTSFELGKGFFCAVSHDTIYAMGGKGTSKQCIEIKPHQQTCHQISSMITQKEKGHAFWYHGNLYAFGGQYPAEIECYFPDIDCWCFVEDFTISTHPAKVYARGGDLYLVNDADEVEVNIVSLEKLQNVVKPKEPRVDLSTACLF